MATKITNKELNERMNKVEARMDEIDSKLDSILESINGKPNGGRNSNGNKNGNKGGSTPKAKKCTVEVVDGQGRGQGKKFIQVTFDGKPTKDTIDTLKGNGFKYFAPTQVWSTLHTDAKLKKAKSIEKSLTK